MKNKFKFTPSGVIIALSSLLICLYYFVYMLLCFSGIDAPIMSIFALFVMGCVLFPVIFREKVKKLFEKKYRALKIIFAVLLLLYILSVIGFWCYIGADSAMTPEHYIESFDEGYSGDDTIVMVFGCRTFGMTPGKTLDLRLKAAYTLLAELPDALCIVSGGQGANETVPEALAMRQYLIDLGIDGERILMESKSHSTSENIRYSKALIEESGLGDKKIIGVSTAFHLPRITALANRYDLPMEVCSSPHVSFWYHYVSMVREYLSYIKMAILG